MATDAGQQGCRAARRSRCGRLRGVASEHEVVPSARDPAWGPLSRILRALDLRHIRQIPDIDATGRDGGVSTGASCLPRSSPPLVDRTKEQALLVDLATGGGRGVRSSRPRSRVRPASANHGSSPRPISRADGIRQLWWGAAEEDDDRPFAALADALGCRRTAAEPAQREIAALLAGAVASMTQVPARSPDAPELQFRLVEAFVDLVENLLRSGGPAVLVLDDLHWADDGTLVALRHIGRRLRALPLLVIGAYRPLPTSRRARSHDLVAANRTAPRPSHSARSTPPPSPTSPRQLHGAPPGDSLLRALDGAAGQPAVRRRAGPGCAGGGRRRDRRRPSRVAFARPAADVSCAHPAPRAGPFAGRRRRVAGGCRPRLLLLRRRPLRRSRPSSRRAARSRSRNASTTASSATTATCWSSATTLIRDAICQDLSGDLERELHRDIGRALATAEGPTLRAAHHLVRGARQGDDDAAGWLLRGRPAGGGRCAGAGARAARPRPRPVAAERSGARGHVDRTGAGAAVGRAG